MGMGISVPWGLGNAGVPTLFFSVGAPTLKWLLGIAGAKAQAGCSDHHAHQTLSDIFISDIFVAETTRGAIVFTSHIIAIP